MLAWLYVVLIGLFLHMPRPFVTCVCAVLVWGDGSHYIAIANNIFMLYLIIVFMLYESAGMI
jgi:hypothetical protein